MKGKLSIMIYAAAVGLAFVNVWLADGLYVLVAMIWLVPDRRIEKPVPSSSHHRGTDFASALLAAGGQRPKKEKAVMPACHAFL